MTALYRALLFVSLAGPILLLEETTTPLCIVAFAILCGVVFFTLDGNSLRQAESRSRPAITAAGIVFVLLLLQLVAWPPEAMTHPIWKSASGALGKELGSRITVDPSKTIGNAIQLLFLICALMTTAAICSDPRKARMVHRFICVAVYLTCAAVFAFDWVEPGRLAPSPLPALSIAALITATSLFLHNGKESLALKQNLPELLLVILGILLGIGAIAAVHHPSTVLIAIGGVILTALVMLLPGAKWPRRTPIVLAAAVTLVAVGFAIYVPRVLTDTLGPVGTAASDATSSLGRMISDVPILGTGGGTFSTLAQIYARDSTEPLRPPSLVAKLYVEYGAVGLAIIAFAWLLVSFELVAGALRRMRDRYLCASAAALSLAIALEAFFDASAASAALQLLVAMLLGIGLAQRESSAR